MMFDAMCRAAEYGAPDLAGRLRYAALLKTDIVGPAVVGNDLYEKAYSDFRLPWKATCVEMMTPAAKTLQGTERAAAPTCVFMERLGKMSGASLDTSTRASTVDIGLVSGDVLLVAFTVKGKVCPTTWRSEIVIKVHGCDVWTPRDRLTMTLEGVGTYKGLSAIHAFLHKQGAAPLPEAEFGETLLLMIGQRFASAAEVIRKSVAPGNWIVKQQTSSKFKDPTHSTKIPRSHQRPHWLLITDEERVRYFRNDAPSESADGKEVTPHPRRAHYRHIGENEDGSKKYTWVRACWVGSTEAEIRGARYKVELDL